MTFIRPERSCHPGESRRQSTRKRTVLVVGLLDVIVSYLALVPLTSYFSTT